MLIQDSIDLLNDKGIIYISFPMGTGETEITEHDFDSFLSKLSEVTEIGREKVNEANNEIMIYEGRKEKST